MALYLKYRPLDFSSLVGQEFIKMNLKTAVSEDKTVGAYIFTGPRGTGKTSTARIFAMGINCYCTNRNQEDLNRDDNSYNVIWRELSSFTKNDVKQASEIVVNFLDYTQGKKKLLDITGSFLNKLGVRKNIGYDTVEYLNNNMSLNIDLNEYFKDAKSPCGICLNCKEFEHGSLIDIIEIDAASHTGVDNIREIIQKAQFSPTRTKYKVYIIDEVHMLSKGAFNALLKILEEPPQHVKFILATTEIHKVPDTILSRCQRYDFKNFTDQEIKGRLQFIADSEGVSVDEKSYEYIVKSAEGGMRNAVSLFEQLINDNSISYDQIVASLGIMSQEEKQSFITKIFTHDISLLEDFDSHCESGKNMKMFFKDILSLIQKQTIASLQGGNDISANIHIMDIISETLMKSKNSFDESMTYRIGLLKIVSQYDSREIIQQDHKSSISISPSLPKKQSAKNQIDSTQKSKETTPGEKVQDDIISGAENIFSQPKKAKENNGNNTETIDVLALISATKENGGKAALSMTLKGSMYEIKDGVIHISTKTSIAKNTLNKSENRDILFLALEKIGVSISDISIS